MESQNFFDRGVAKVKNVVSEVSIEQREFMKSFARLCQDGWNQGWHESNGGNLSYRMTFDEVSACRSYFLEYFGPWQPLGVEAAGLAGEHFAVTGAGKHFRSAGIDPSGNIGIVEINQAGNAWRLVWGLKNGGGPTSEFATHFRVHAVRKAVSDGADRVVYHAHPSCIIALTLVLKPDSGTFSRTLWKSLTESILALPQGIGVLPWETPGSLKIAEATSALMEKHPAAVWAHHGVLCAAPDFEKAFGLMQTIEKSADIYLKACAAHGSSRLPQQIYDDDVRAAAEAFGVAINEEYLA